MAVQKNNNNTMHTNLNCRILKDSTKSTYDIIVLEKMKKCMNNENAPRKNSQKNAEI